MGFVFLPASTDWSDFLGVKCQHICPPILQISGLWSRFVWLLQVSEYKFVRESINDSTMIPRVFPFVLLNSMMPELAM